MRREGREKGAKNKNKINRDNENTREKAENARQVAKL